MAAPRPGRCPRHKSARPTRVLAELLRGVVDESPHARGHRATAGWDGLTGQGCRIMGGRHLLRTRGRDHFGKQQGRADGQTQPNQQRRAHPVGRAHPHPARNLQVGRRAFVGHELPFVHRCNAGLQDAVGQPQVKPRKRPPGLGETRRPRDGHVPHHADPVHDQPLIGKGGDPDRKVHADFDQIDRAVWRSGCAPGNRALRGIRWGGAKAIGAAMRRVPSTVATAFHGPRAWAEEMRLLSASVSARAMRPIRRTPRWPANAEILRLMVGCDRGETAGFDGRHKGADRFQTAGIAVSRLSPSSDLARVSWTFGWRIFLPMDPVAAIDPSEAPSQLDDLGLACRLVPKNIRLAPERRRGIWPRTPTPRCRVWWTGASRCPSQGRCWCTSPTRPTGGPT